MARQAVAATRVDTSVLCRLLGEWRQPGIRLTEALAAGVADLVDASVLPDGAVLPSQRHLAEALGVSRVTVAGAYDVLRARERLTARQGSGSRVRRTPDIIAPGASNRTEGRLASHTGHEPGAIDLTSGALPGLPLVAEVLGSLPPSAVTDLVAGDGYYPAGLPVLRAAVAARYADDGWATETGNVLVTAGAQQAVWLVAHTLVASGDVVLVEEPTYRGSLEAFRACGARLVSVPMSERGLDLDHLERVLAHHRPRLLYVQPTAHNPTGRSMGPRERRRLAEIVQRYAVLTVEDACAADLMLDGGGRRLPWGSLLPDGDVLTIATASKLFWGGLRVGWIRGPRSAITRLTEARKAVDMSGAAIDQVLTARLLRHAERAEVERRSQLRLALARSSEVLAKVHPRWRWVPPSGGTGLWVDTGEDAVALAERGLRNGVRVVPGPTSSVFGGFGSYLRLPFWHPVEEFREGLTRLR